jgi:putative hydrolase of the HAD superfamily
VIEVVAFDGDNTLWHNESIFSLTQDRFFELMAPYLEDQPDLGRRLHDTELRNLDLYGYGIKSFTLSMIETAIEVSQGRVTATEVSVILEAAKHMLAHPVELLDGVADAVEQVSADYPVMLVTKGDLLDQESKLARSGLGERFASVEIVSEKNPRTYERILERRAIPPERFVMVGDSLRSDIGPVLEVGGWAVHVPYHLTWAHELVDDEARLRGHSRFHHLDSLGELPSVLASIDHDGSNEPAQTH